MGQPFCHLLEMASSAARESACELSTAALLRQPVRESLLKLPLRVLPARLATAAAKRMSVDLRLLWEESSHREAAITLLSAGPADVATNLIERWYATTAEGRGWRWGCAMVSAFRLAVIALHAGVASPSASWLEREYRYICRHLERASDNNHYFYNVIGLLIAQTLQGRPDDPEALGRPPAEELERLVDRYFLPDGAWFEASSAYHFLVCEGLALASIISGSVRETCEARRGILTSAHAFMRSVLTSEGRLLQIGDNDGAGCFLPMETIGLRAFQCRFYEKTFGIEPTTENEATFGTFGLVVRRFGAARLATYATANGQHGKGGHAHNDKLSVAIAAGGDWLVTDSGCFSYTCERNHFRSAAAHSTVLVVGAEPCPLGVGRFRLPDNARAHIESAGKDEWSLRCHYGPFQLRRSFVRHGAKVSVIDMVEGSVAGARIRTQFVLSPRARIQKDAVGGFQVLDSRGTSFLQITPDTPAKANVVETKVSESYGLKGVSNTVMWEWLDDVRTLAWTIRAIGSG